MASLKRLRLVRAYLRALDRHPRATMCLTTASLHAGGDVIAQKLIEKRERLEAARTARFFLIGLAWDGPLLSWWYRFLSLRIPSTTSSATVCKVALDQLCFIPFMLASFLSINATLKGMSTEDVGRILKRDYLHLLAANYQLWPAAMALNFYLTPLKHQVLFTNSVSLGWNTYLSWRANKELLRLGASSAAADAAQASQRPTRLSQLPTRASQRPPQLCQQSTQLSLRCRREDGCSGCCSSSEDNDDRLECPAEKDSDAGNDANADNAAADPPNAPNAADASNGAVKKRIDNDFVMFAAVSCHVMSLSPFAGVSMPVFDINSPSHNHYYASHNHYRASRNRYHAVPACFLDRRHAPLPR